MPHRRNPSLATVTLAQLYLDSLAEGRGVWIATRAEALSERISLGHKGYRCRTGRATRDLTDAALTWARSARYPELPAGAW